MGHDLSWISDDSRVFGEVCDRCHRQQLFGSSEGLKKYVDEKGEEWLLCAACHPCFNDNDEIIEL